MHIYQVLGAAFMAVQASAAPILGSKERVVPTLAITGNLANLIGNLDDDTFGSIISDTLPFAPRSNTGRSAPPAERQKITATALPGLSDSASPIVDYLSDILNSYAVQDIQTRDSAHPIEKRMKHLAAYLLLGLGGNTSPAAEDVKEVLSAVGIDADDERLNKLLEELGGKDVSELTSESSE